MKSTHRSIIKEAETVYMSEGLSDILYESEDTTVEIEEKDVSTITLQEESGSRTVILTVSAVACGGTHSLELFGKRIVLKGFPSVTRFKVTSVTYDRTTNSVVLQGLMLNT